MIFFNFFPTALAVDLWTVRGLPGDRDRLVGHHWRKWFVTTVLTLPTHVLQPHRILYGFSVMIQKQFFRVFQLFVREVKHFYQKNT